MRIKYLILKSLYIIFVFTICAYSNELRLKDSLALVAIVKANPHSNDFDWKFRQKLEKWKGLTVKNNRIIELSLRHCKVDTLPPEVGHLTALEYLDLSNPISDKRLASSYDTFWDLYLLTELPDEIGSLRNLRFLNLEGNCINTLPEGFYSLRNLEVLNLKFNGPWYSYSGYRNFPKVIDLFSDEIKNLNKLKVLNLSNNNISRVPQNISAIKNLEKLYLINTRISGFSSVDTFPELKELYLRRTPIRFLSPLSRFPKLELLDISITQSDTLPKDISHLSKLKKLNLSYNHRLPLNDLIKIKSTLEELNISSCKLNKKMMSEWNTLFSLSNLKQLNLSYNSLDSLPKDIAKLKNLRRLVLEGNKLTTLPSEIKHLNDLEFLDLKSNKFDTLPLILSELQKCKEILLRKNKVSFFDVPRSFRKKDTKIRRNIMYLKHSGYTFPPFLGWRNGDNKSLILGIRGGPIFNLQTNRFLQVVSPQLGYYGHLNDIYFRQLFYLGGSYTPFDPDLYTGMGISANGGIIRGVDDDRKLVKGARASLTTFFIPFISFGIEFAFSRINKENKLEVLFFKGHVRNK